MTLKLKVKPKLPAKLLPGVAVAIDKDGLTYTIRLDLSAINPVVTIDPLQESALLFNMLDGSYSLISMAAFLSNGLATRIITAAGDVNIGPSDGLIILAKDTAEDTNFNLPAAATKIGPVKIVDFNGAASSHTLKIIPDGSETINSQTDWTIGGDYGSIVLHPVSGMGYAA
jgi:hypothetical protein